MSESEPVGSKDNPVWMRFVRDEDGIKWGNLLVMLAFTVVSGYLATQAQRAGSKPDAMHELKMRVARAQITAGSKLVRIGKSVEEAGWTAYERVR